MQISKVAFWCTQEDRRADQQVAHRAAADAGHHREEDESDQSLLLHRREQRARQREHGDARHVEEIEDRAEGGGEVGDGHEGFVSQSAKKESSGGGRDP
jgi:hypothetical protein